MRTQEKEKFTAIYPDEGKWLTQKELIEDEERIFSDSVFTTTPQLWEEWTESQKEQREQEHQLED